MFAVDAHRDDKKRFVVRANEKLTAFVELKAVVIIGGNSKKKRRQQPSDSPLVLNRKSEVEAGTATLRVLHRDSTAMRFHN